MVQVCLSSNNAALAPKTASRTAKLLDSLHSCSHPLSKSFRFILGKECLARNLPFCTYTASMSYHTPILSTFRYIFVYVPVSDNTIKLALDIWISPHSQQNLCLFRRPFISRHFAHHSHRLRTQRKWCAFPWLRWFLGCFTTRACCAVRVNVTCVYSKIRVNQHAE